MTLLSRKHCEKQKRTKIRRMIKIQSDSVALNITRFNESVVDLVKIDFGF